MKECKMLKKIHKVEEIFAKIWQIEALMVHGKPDRMNQHELLMAALLVAAAIGWLWFTFQFE